MNSGADGFRSEGLRIKVFPQAMALGNIHKGTMTGKLKGVIPTQHRPVDELYKRPRRLMLARCMNL